MIFTEFADTAEYLREQLIAAGITGVEAVDGSSAGRAPVDVIKRFAPHYNNAAGARAAHGAGNCVLVSPHVLSGGLNPPGATRPINYHPPWKPLRLIQRI